MPKIGDKLDRYIIEAVLGEGGMGRVYRALDPRLGRRVALKVLLAEGRSEKVRADAAERMMREARAVAAFSHPNVVAVYDVGEIDGNPFIAMEIVSGSTLRAYVGDPQLTNDHRLEWLTAVARGLGAAHRVGLVHRDIKPENVMIAADGIVKILDFGIARRTADTGATDAGVAAAPTHLPSLTAEGVMIGTPQYMAPEQLQAEALDGRADQFAWGVMSWELFTGALPWGASKAGAQLVAAVLASPVRALRDVSPSLRGSVSDVVARALSKSRDDRFATMEELLVALEGKKARAPAPSSHDVALETTSKQESVPRVEQSRAGDRAAAAVALPLTTGAAAVSTRAVEPSGPQLPGSNSTPNASRVAGSENRERALARSARGSQWRTLATIAGALAIVGAGGVAWMREHRLPAAPATGAASASTPPSPARAPPSLAERAELEEREGRRDLACKDFRQVSDTEQGNALAAYTTALTCGVYSGPGGGPVPARPYFQRAWDQRASLSPAQVAILDALQPMFFRDPWDRREVLNRLDSAAKRFPDDAQVHSLLARAHSWFVEDAKLEVEEMERSLALDANQPHTLAILADHLAYDGDFDGARAAIARCLRLSTVTQNCLQEQAWLDGELGLCDAEEADARQWLVADPSSTEAENVLANALYSQGTGLPALRSVLARKRTKMSEDERVAAERKDERNLAILGGDLPAAERNAKALLDAVSSSTEQSDHGAAARTLVMLYDEMGRPAEAANVAAAYLDGRDAWQPDPELDDWAMLAEPTPLMLAARMRAGLLSRDAYEREIARTAKRWSSRANPSVRNFIWIYAYAAPSETTQDATFAMSALAEFSPLPPYKPLSLADAEIGRTYFLASKLDEAMTYLERAAHNCFPIDHPIENTRSNYFLGMAREAKGDTKGACDAYRVVRDRWGSTKSKSVTARKALARVAALKCGD